MGACYRFLPRSVAMATMCVVAFVCISDQQRSSVAAFGKYFQQLGYTRFADCEPAFRASVIECASSCEALGKSCLGTNFRPLDKSVWRSERIGWCEICMSSKSRLISPNSTKTPAYSYIQFNKVLYGHDNNGWLKLPEGLYDGQLILVRIVPDGNTNVILFTPDPTSYTLRQTGSGPLIRHCNCLIYLEANFDRGIITLDTHIEDSLLLTGSQAVISVVSDYLRPGQESELMFFVNSTHYCVYIDGRELALYPRPSYQDVADIRNLVVDGDMSIYRVE